MSTPEGPATESEAKLSQEAGNETPEADEQMSLSAFDRKELETLITELRAENRRLRADYSRAKQQSYQRSSVALLLLGLSGVLGGLALPAAREVLLILGSAGLFAGVLLRYLTPEQFVSATMGQSVYDAFAETAVRLRDELGLDGTQVYVPTTEMEGSGVPVRLFVSQSSGDMPAAGELTSLFVLPESAEQRGVSFRPTAARLVAEFDKSAKISDISELDDLAAGLVDALVEQFGLVEQAVPEVDPDGQRLTVSVKGGPYGREASFDHPVASFLGTGLAFALHEPVEVETVTDGDELLITCRWSATNG